MMSCFSSTNNTLTRSEQHTSIDEMILNTKKRRNSSISTASNHSSGDEDEEKREKRRVANRKASVACRLRKKIFITELQRQVSELTQRNAEIEEENVMLRKAFELKVAAEKAANQQQLIANLQQPVHPTSSYDFCSQTQLATTDAASTVTMSPAPPQVRPTKEDLYAALVKTALAEYQQQRRVAMVEQRACV